MVSDEFGDEDEEDPNEGLIRPHGDTITRALARLSVILGIEAPPDRGRRGGGTVTKEWLVSCADALDVDATGAKKQDVVRIILRASDKPVDEEAYFSTGATVTLHALHAIEEIAENRGV